jgi:hypothetical protein
VRTELLDTTSQPLAKSMAQVERWIAERRGLLGPLFGR